MTMYENVMAVVEHNNEFSNTFQLLSGIRQGSPTSGILYIAYTCDLISLFNSLFNVEDLIDSKEGDDLDVGLPDDPDKLKEEVFKARADASKWKKVAEDLKKAQTSTSTENEFSSFITHPD